MTDHAKGPHGVLRSETIRASNARLVLNALSAFGEATRAQLSDRTSLSRQALGPILRSLQEDGLVERYRDPVARRGRPATVYAVAPSGSLSAVLIQRPSELEIFVSDALGDIIASTSVPSAWGTRAEAVAFGAISEMNRLLAQHDLDRSRLSKVTFSVEGVVDDERHIVHDSPAWADEAIVVDDLVIDLLPDPIDLTVSSSSRLMARAAIESAGVDDRELVMVLQIDTEVWLYVAQHGAIISGRSGTTGYISHERIRDNARICRCGRTGCFATILEDRKVDIDETFEMLATGISPMVRVIDPDQLIVSGPWTIDDEPRRQRLEQILQDCLSLPTHVTSVPAPFATSPAGESST